MIESTARTKPLVVVVNDKQGEAVDKQLADRFRVTRLESGSAAELMARFDRSQPDCAVMAMDPLELNKETIGEWMELRRYCERSHIPFVVATSSYDWELTGTLMADAVLREPFDSNEVQSNLERLIERRQRILDQILVDPATGVYNSRYLYREVRKQLQDMKRSYESFSLVFLEIDSIPELDQEDRRRATKALADFIQASVRPMDCLGEHAEPGFVLVLPKTAKEDALKLMRRLSDLFTDTLLQTHDRARKVTFSAKVRDFSDSNLTAEECLALMPFSSDTDPSERAGLVLDGTLNDNSAKTRKLLIAVIDDDRLIREMLKHQLADIGESHYEVEIREYSDGEQFFDDPWHRQNERYLMIIDRVMPKMDGLEVLHRIRNGYDRRRYLCIMLSSKGAETDITLAIQRGANDYMVKPFRVKELRARIKRLIGGF